MQGIDSDLIRGHIDTIILKILYEGDRYGLEIMKEVEEKSNGAYEMKQPTLYSCLKRLETQGLISSYWEDSDIGGKRHYYKLTDAGRDAYQANYDDWMRSRKIIDNLISSSLYEGSQYVVVKKDEIDEQQTPASSPAPTEPKHNYAEESTTIVKYDDEQTIPWGQENPSVSASSPTLQSDNIIDFAKNGESVSAVPYQGEEPENEQDEWADVDEAQASLFEEESQVFANEEQPAAIEHHQEPQVDYTEKPRLPEPEAKPESTTPFEFRLDDYNVDSNDSYFDSREANEPSPDYVAPEMRIDGLEESTALAEEPKQEEPEPVYNTPVYHDFGANYVKPKEDEIWVDESNLDEDAIYLNPEQAKDEDQPDQNQVSDGQLSLFSEDIQESDSQAQEEPQEEPNKISAGNMAFYKPTENYANLNPQYTETEYKDKLSSLMSYTAHDEQPAEKHEEPIMVAKDYEQLRAEFEKEGLSVRPHQKLLKESRKTRSYVESNKLNLVRSWTTFGIITFLLCLTGLIMNNYKSRFGFDFKFDYFLIGIAAVAIVPIIYTILFIINPYKKKPAHYAFRIYLIFSILLTVQMLIIVYCVSLQLGFYSFTQPLFNHLIWVIPSIISLYPILDALIHSLYFNSRNFHV